MNSSGKIVNLVNPSSNQDAATKLYVDITSFPIGGIVMWSGAGVTLPSNWKLCDGTTYGSVTTPDLRSRFVIGATAVGASGGGSKGILVESNHTKVGPDIFGDGTNERFGYSVSISADGTIVAVGAPYNMGTSQSMNKGVTRVYKYNGTTWSQLGSDISGNGTVEYNGASVSLSADGTTVAVGAYLSNDNRGVVRVYKYNALTNKWSQMVSDLTGTGTVGEEFGRSLSLSADGTILAVRSSYMFRVYKYNGSQWNNFGSDVVTSGIIDYVSLSSDGTTLAICMRYLNESYLGLTRIYKYDAATNAWPHFGSDITGNTTNQSFGLSVSLSSNGTIVAVGVPLANDVKGITRVYKYNATTNTWPQLGTNLFGDNIFDEESGSSVSLSADGTIVAVGGRKYNTYKGVTRLYKHDGNSWNQIGLNIFGDGTVESSGHSVSLSADGTSVAVGAPDSKSNKGVTRVYKVLNPNIYTVAFIMRIS